jgi:hypothetical protein
VSALDWIIVPDCSWDQACYNNPISTNCCI